MRYLFVTWDGGGNLHSVLPLAERLVGLGHEVRFLGNRSQRQTIEARGCSFGAFERAPDHVSDSAGDALLDDWRPRTPLARAALFRDGLLVGPAALYAADVLEEVERHRPDALAVDYLLFGAVAAAERSGLPTAALWHTVYSPPSVETPTFGSGLGLPRGPASRFAVRASRRLSGAWWNRSLASLNAMRAEFGLAPLNATFEQFDRLDRVLVMSSSAFDFAGLTGAELPTNVRYVGPQLRAVGPAAARDDPPLVLVSLSTTYQAQEKLLLRAVEALGELPVRGLVTTGPAVSLEGDPPANVEVRPWVEHSEVLPRASLVLTHAGLGTVMASLANGVPLLCAPMGRDQPCVTARVRHSGAGVRLARNPRKRAIASAIQSALGDPGLRENAERLQDLLLKEISADRGVKEMLALGRPGG